MVVHHDNTHKLRVATVSSLRAIPAQSWDRLLGDDSFYLSHRWLSTVERDGVARASYVVAESAGRPVGALPLYQPLREGSVDYSIARLGPLLGLRGNYVLAGARMANRGGYALAPELDAVERTTVTRALVEAALDQAAAVGAAGVILPFLPTVELDSLAAAVSVVAAADGSESVLPRIGTGLDTYLHELPKKRRWSALREQQAFREAGWHHGTERLSACAAEVATLVSKVNAHHGYLTPDFLLRRIFRWQADALDSESVVFTCRDDAGGLVACALNFCWRDGLYLHAVGLEYPRLRAFEYFNLLVYRPVAYAAEHGLDRLHLGLSTRAKTLRRAVDCPLWSAAVLRDTVDRPAGLSWARPPGGLHAWPGDDRLLRK